MLRVATQQLKSPIHKGKSQNLTNFGDVHLFLLQLFSVGKPSWPLGSPNTALQELRTSQVSKKHPVLCSPFNGKGETAATHLWSLAVPLEKADSLRANWPSV